MKGLIAVFSMLIIIFDSKTALQGTSEGLQLCLQTIIPSLFPFFVLSGVLNHYLIGRKVSFLRPICNHCGIPDGCESLFLLGLVAGYPIGAQLISQAYEESAISKSTAHRMLGFCNNAGPAFIFGILPPFFSNIYYVWIIWGIQIFSAILVGLLLPQKEVRGGDIRRVPPVSIVAALQKAINNIAVVCGWVILFRMIIAFSEKWFLWRFSPVFKVIYYGLIELSNGIIQLQYIPSEAIRFVFASVILAAGGLCVTLQTCSVTALLGTGYYFPGKILQALLCILISIILQNFMFAGTGCISIPAIIYGILTICILSVIYFLRKTVAIHK